MREGKSLKGYRIEYTEDYKELKELYIKCGLEVGNEPVPTKLVKCWRVVADTGEGDTLIGGATLGDRDGTYVVDGIAIEAKYRNRDIGTKVLDKLLSHSRDIGIKKLWLVAVAPGFFKKYGFIKAKREGAPNVFGCFNCEKYGKECKPEVMFLEL